MSAIQLGTDYPNLTPFDAFIAGVSVCNAQINPQLIFRLIKKLNEYLEVNLIS